MSLREKLNNNPKIVTIATVVLIALAIFVIYLQLRPNRPKPVQPPPGQPTAAPRGRPAPADQGGGGAPEQEQPAGDQPAGQ